MYDIAPLWLEIVSELPLWCLLKTKQRLEATEKKRR